MWFKKETIKTNATREQIWNLWSDVKNWKQWDSEIAFSDLKGEFKVGTFGMLKPIKGPKSKFKIVSINELNEFTTRSFLPFTKMDFIHEINEKDGELFITHGIEIRGLLSFFFSKVIGENLIKELPKAMNKLSELAENN